MARSLEVSQFTYAALARACAQHHGTARVAPQTFATLDVSRTPTGEIEVSCIDIRLCGHHIATVYESGALWLGDCGHPTALTVSRLAPILAASAHAEAHGYSVKLYGGTHVMLVTPWRLATISDARQDGVYIESDGTVFDGTATDVYVLPDGLRQQEQRVRAAIADSPKHAAVHWDGRQSFVVREVSPGKYRAERHMGEYIPPTNIKPLAWIVGGIDEIAGIVHYSALWEPATR